jgi:hypothetical protein
MGLDHLIAIGAFLSWVRSDNNAVAYAQTPPRSVSAWRATVMVPGVPVAPGAKMPAALIVVPLTVPVPARPSAPALTLEPSGSDRPRAGR